MTCSEESLYCLAEAQNCSYSLVNTWNCDPGKIAPYLQDFRVDRYGYRLIPNGQLVSPALIGLGNHWELLPETAPFGNIRSRSLWKIRATSYFPICKHFDYPICCLLDWQRWHDAYFHWLFDTLPRALAALDYQQKTKSKVGLLVSSDIKQWQIDSLVRLGLDQGSFILINRSDINTSISSSALIVAPPARGQGLYGSPYDCMHPGLVRQLAYKLINVPGGLGSCLEKIIKIFISRGDAQTRRIINEDKVSTLLESHGFRVIYLANMAFDDQVNLFGSASHIVAAHGGGLSNLLFSSKANILELFADGHEVRPDYFQLATIKSLSYYYYVSASVNQSNDFFLDLFVLEKFIELTC